MMLQPLMENALEHGIALRPGAGRVAVRARRSGENLWVRVEDSGPGFGLRIADSVNGIGLSNSRARLEQLYGSRHRLICGDAPSGGAFVEVHLPFRPSPEEVDNE